MLFPAYIVISVVDWAEKGKKLLGFKPSIVTSDDLETIRNVALLRYATSLFKPNDWMKVIEGLVKEGYLTEIKEIIYSNGKISAIVNGYTVTKHGRKVAEEVNEMIKKYGGENDFMYGIGYDTLYYAKMYLRAVATYLSNLCYHEFYKRSDEGKRCEKTLDRIKDFVKIEYKEYNRFKYFEPLALYLLLFYI